MAIILNPYRQVIELKLNNSIVKNSDLINYLDRSVINRLKKKFSKNPFKNQ